LKAPKKGGGCGEVGHSQGHSAFEREATSELNKDIETLNVLHDAQAVELGKLHGFKPEIFRQKLNAVTTFKKK
jgi:hypothetical protein